MQAETQRPLTQVNPARQVGTQAGAAGGGGGASSSVDAVDAVDEAVAGDVSDVEVLVVGDGDVSAAAVAGEVAGDVTGTETGAGSCARAAETMRQVQAKRHKRNRMARYLPNPGHKNDPSAVSSAPVAARELAFGVLLPPKVGAHQHEPAILA